MVTLFGQGGYDYAPVIRNLIGDTHDGGGFSGSSACIRPGIPAMRAITERRSGGSRPGGPRVLPRAALLVVAGASLAALGGDCEGNIVQDPTFRDWCGSSLCAWQLDSGRIQRVPTWNADDFGVSFLDQGTEISQVTQEDAATCLLFTTVADIDPSAQMTILVDFDNDGVVDFQAPLGATDWHQVQAEITAPPVYHGITFRLKKEGTGTAVLAEMQIQSTTGCTAPAAVVPPATARGCLCDERRLPEGLVCTSGNLCAQCDDGNPCGSGVSCASRVFLAEQCGPGQGLGRPGDPCARRRLRERRLRRHVGHVHRRALRHAGRRMPDRRSEGDVDAALDSSASVCACFLNHGGTCH